MVVPGYWLRRTGERRLEQPEECAKLGQSMSKRLWLIRTAGKVHVMVTDLVYGNLLRMVLFPNLYGHTSWK